MFFLFFHFKSAGWNIFVVVTVDFLIFISFSHYDRSGLISYTWRIFRAKRSLHTWMKHSLYYAIPGRMRWSSEHFRKLSLYSNDHYDSKSMKLNLRIFFPWIVPCCSNLIMVFARPPKLTWSSLKNQIQYLMFWKLFDVGFFCLFYWKDPSSSYVKFITPPVACNTTGQRQCELYFGHTGNHYFALKKKAR